jgi:hypothetical protein
MTPRSLGGLLLAGALVIGPIAKPNFSGRWDLDKDKSTARETFKKSPDPKAASGPPPPPADVDVPPEIIEHQEPMLKITLPDETGGEATTLTFMTDGKESVSTVSGGKVVRRSRSHWENGELVTEWTLERDGEIILRGREVRALSADGKVQIVDQHIETANAVRDIHSVFRKKAT